MDHDLPGGVPDTWNTPSTASTPTAMPQTTYTSFDPSTSTSSESHDSHSDSESVSEVEYEFEEKETWVTKLAKEWMLLELTHRVSKTATDAFWKLATTTFTQKLGIAKVPKIPTFRTLRTHIQRTMLPKITITTCYKDENGELQQDVQETTRVSKFPAKHFEKQYRIASVKV